MAGAMGMILSWTNSPTGSACFTAALYASTSGRDTSGSAKLNIAAPMPMRPASSTVPGFEAVTQSGGWGRCTGFGSTQRSGTEKYFPCHEKRSCVHIFGIARIDSSHIARVSSAETPKVFTSVEPLPRPVPSSTRPFVRMSIIAICSATRTGWLIGGQRLKIPVTTRMRRVWTPTARHDRCEEELCEYSSRQWCSGAQNVSKPARSAAMPTSMSLRMRRASFPFHGRGPTDAPWHTPNSSGMAREYTRAPMSAMQRLHESVWVAPSAELYGRITIGEGSSVWPQCVIRAECEEVCVGRHTNLQDFVMIHVDPGSPTVIGDF